MDDLKFKTAFEYLNKICTFYVREIGNNNRRQMTELLEFADKFKRKDYSKINHLERALPQLKANREFYIMALYVIDFVKQEM